MRRDMELVRRIFNDIVNGSVKMDYRFSGNNGNENRVYAYHLEIMRQAGLIQYTEQNYKGGVLLPKSPALTWEGNDFFEAIENDNLWNKAKSTASEQGLELTTLPFDVIKGYLKLKAKELLGLDI